VIDNLQEPNRQEPTVNPTTHRLFLRPLVGLVLAAAAVAVPAASAGAATHSSAPAENRYCDSESGYDCQSYGYGPDYQGDPARDTHHRY
jgi:hypothetical protein